MHKNLKFYLILPLFYLLIALQTEVYAQRYIKKSDQLVEKARIAERNRNAEQALTLYKKALDKYDANQEAWYRMGLLYRMFFNDRDSMLWSFERLLSVDEAVEKQYYSAYVHAADLNYRKGNYSRADRLMKEYLDLAKPSGKTLQQANSLYTDIVFSLTNQIPENQKAKFKALHVPNAPKQIYFPELTPDKSLLLFTAMNQGMENIYVGKPLGDNEWSSPESISANINTYDNEGAASISADGRTLILTACNRRDGFGSCDLYISRKEGNEWSRPENLGKSINTGAWESQPALSADGRSLYFVSNRGGGIGGRDIYVSYYRDGNWTKAENLGFNINTTADEISPFIFADGRSLFFGSNGYSSFGGFDIYFTQNKNGKWSIPVNIGNHINNHLDQISIFVSSDKQDVFFSSEEVINRERYSNIYHTDMSALPGISLEENGYVKGKITNAENNKAIAANIQLFDLASDTLLYEVNSDAYSGEYLIVLPYPSAFALYVDQKGYMLSSKSFSISERSQIYQLDVALSPIKEGQKLILEHIYFEFDSYELTEQSITEAKRIVQFLEQNKTVKVEIAGYTDNVGSAEYNLALSQKRANAVKEKLLAYGISENRLKSKGYGAQSGDDSSRRVELVVLK